MTIASFHHGLAWLTVGLSVVACVPSGLRWLRVAQREHYLAGSASQFAERWWNSTLANRAAGAVAFAAAIASAWWPVAGVATAVIVAGGPLGLSLKGRTSPLVWTRRLRALAVVWAVLELMVVAVGIVTGLASVLAVLAALAVPVLVDAACALASPVEDRLARHFVSEAAARLARVAPTVVAVTGSFGKTSTKNHIAHLVGASHSVVATPASFNNRAGLARAVNEHLADGTEVFVAEMGTYGPGEIADMCRWCPPEIAVITAIGPVHLERFGSEDRIVEAKAEITVGASQVVLQVDDLRLSALADRLVGPGVRVIRCSALDRSADVCVADPRDGSGVSVWNSDHLVDSGVSLPTGVQATNVACALGVALALGIDVGVAVQRLGDLPTVDHRLQPVVAASGCAVLDDTYNSNPSGARAALAALASLGDAGGQRVVVTPGMVELGRRQREENQRLGAEVISMGASLVIVGRTNRRAMLRGARSVTGSGVTSSKVAAARIICVPDRPAAVAWVRAHLGIGDAVLYENDLPDHYP